MKNKPKEPFYYLLASAATLLFYVGILPLVDGATAHILNHFNLGNLKLQNKANELAPKEDGEPQSQVNVIGFEVPSQEIIEGDEEDY